MFRLGWSWTRSWNLGPDGRLLMGIPAMDMIEEIAYGFR